MNRNKLIGITAVNFIIFYIMGFINELINNTDYPWIKRYNLAYMGLSLLITGILWFVFTIYLWIIWLDPDEFPNQYKKIFEDNE